MALARALAPDAQGAVAGRAAESALDLKLRKEMQIELKRLQLETGITFVFVTHDQEEALTMSDRIGVMSAGHLQQVGSPKRHLQPSPVNRFVAEFHRRDELPARGCAKVPLYRLDCGATCCRPRRRMRTGAVTLTVRPEQVRIVAVDEPELRSPPDSHQRWSISAPIRTVHMALSDGTPRSMARAAKPGHRRVMVWLPVGAVRSGLQLSCPAPCKCLED